MHITHVALDCGRRKEREREREKGVERKEVTGMEFHPNKEGVSECSNAKCFKRKRKG